MAVSLAIKDPHREQSLFSNRAVVVFLIMIVLLGVLVMRLVQLQVWEHDTYQTRSDDNRIHVQAIAPARGLIFDRHGELLADNQTIYNLSLVIERLDSIAGTLQRLNQFISVTPADISEFEQRLARKKRPFEPVVLRLSLTEEERSVLAVNRHRFTGIAIDTELVRHYPYGPLFAHAIGSVRRVNEEDLRELDEVAYTGTKFVGKRGVEKSYEQLLHGEVGFQQVEADAHGRIHGVLDSRPPIFGGNLTLHLDSRLQIAASAALGENRGAVVALDPSTGGVLAMVSHPSYDPNLFVTGMTGEQYKEMSDSLYTPLFNRAINGQYAPGSTIKPIVGLAGIVHKVTTWDETIEDKGWFKLPNQDRIYRDWTWTRNNAGGQGTVDLNRAIYRSSNVYFYDLASRLEIDQLVSFADQFGIGKNLALDIEDASPGLLPNPIWKQGYKGVVWYPGDSVNMGIGQGDLLVTPLQMATVAATIANRGRVVQPRMVVQPDRPSDVASVLPVAGPTPEDWEAMVDSMEDVVHRGNQGFRGNGTAWAHIGRDISYRMAGKSGTAQVVEIKQGEEYDEEVLAESNRKHAWFIAFAPADDPVIALAVLLENGGGGSSTAGPVAREVIDSYLLPKLATR